MPMKPPFHKPPLPFPEFVTLMALIISLIALSIDAMLPALDLIGRDLRVKGENDAQLIISTIFLGVSLGQLLFGPLSDSLGRKPVLLMGLSLFAMGCVLSALSQSLTTMLLGRVIQGFGLSSPRVVSLAIVRDQYKGAPMARVMSFVLMVFIMVPALAPALGQGILMVADWRSIFYVFIALALALVLWFGGRQPETLAPENRKPFSAIPILRAAKEILTHPMVMGYTVVMGLVFSGFLGYLNSIQPILQIQYGLGELFSLYFAVLALAIGGASYFNGRIVMRLGMQRLCLLSLAGLCVISLAYLPVATWYGGHPPLVSLMLYFMLILFSVGFLFGNLNAMAMEPLGHIAGVGASVVGSLSTFLSLPLGIWIGRAYQQSVIPVVAGFAGISLASLFVFWVLKKNTSKMQDN